MNFIGGSDARVIMGKDEKALLPAEKHMAQLQHNMLVAGAKKSVLSIINGGGKWLNSRSKPIRSTRPS